LPCPLAPHPPPSFPTRRSSDLPRHRGRRGVPGRAERRSPGHLRQRLVLRRVRAELRERYGGIRTVRRGERRVWQERLLHRERRRSEEHTSELQSRENLVCRLLL